MKRLLAGLVAIFGLALFAPQQAQAAPADCVLANPTNGSYPYTKAYQCGTAVNADSRTMADRVAGDGILINELRRAGVTFYMYGTPAEYHADFPADPLPTAAAFGTVKYDANNVPVYIAIFEKNGQAPAVANTNIYYTTNLQVADAGDFLLGYMSNGGIQPPANTRFSASALFHGQADSDWTTFKQKTPCTTPATNHYQVFSKYADSTSVDATSTYNYVCNGTNGTGTALNAGYTGLAIDQVLNKAWPAIYTTVNGAAINLNYQGLFQQELAWLMNGNDLATPRSMSAYVSDPNGSQVGTTAVHSFQCTEYQLREIGLIGYLPPKVDANRPTACPVPSTETVCKKRFNQSGYFPDGNVFDCTPPATIGTSVLSNLSKLGGSSLNTSIKQRFNSPILSTVYLFDSQVNYETAFRNAGQAYADLTGLSGGTYPYGPRWYSIILAGSYAPKANPQMYNSAQVTFGAVHELGHALDDTFATQSSSLSAFDLAMQHDWLTLNYTSWTSSTTFVKRDPCALFNGVKGPLTNIVDPGTGVQFCNGNTLEAKWNFGQAGSAYQVISDILLDPTVEGIKGHGFIYQNLPLLIGGNPGYNSLAGWREWHSDAFAIVSIPDTGATQKVNVAQTLVSNGFFQCTAGPSASNSWLFTEYNTAAQPGSPTCQTPLVGWTPIKKSIP